MHPIDCGPLLHTARDWFIQTRSDIFEDIALERTCHGAVTQIVAKRPIFGRKEKKSGESGLLCLLQASDFLLLALALARFCKSDFLAANQKVGSSTLIVKPLCEGPERANAETVNSAAKRVSCRCHVSCGESRQIAINNWKEKVNRTCPILPQLTNSLRFVSAPANRD